MDMLVVSTLILVLLLSIYLYLFFVCKTWAEFGEGDSMCDNKEDDEKTPMEKPKENPPMEQPNPSMDNVE